MACPSISDARAILARHFGYIDFRPPQVAAVEAVLSRRDTVIVLPTGGGKSICFQVPALLFARLTVVVSPLISLMADQVDALGRRGIGATFLNSTLSPEESADRMERLRRGEIKLLYVAPERLTLGPTARLVAEVGVDLLAVDEAHCVSAWGRDFRPSYLQLAAIRRALGNPQIAALTATATPGVRRDIARLLELRNALEIVAGFDRPNLTFRVQAVANEPQRNQEMLRHLRALTSPGVLYAATRRQVEQVTRLLTASRVNAVAYHAGLSPERRARAQSDFMHGRTQVIVATNAFGMGIDKPDVRLVLHYTHSGSLEDYYQEAGRAGRDGERSRCVLLFNPADRDVHIRMKRSGDVDPAVLRGVWELIASDSQGRRRVPADPRSLAYRLGKGADVETVERAVRLLQGQGILAAGDPASTLRIRVLASPLRIECERYALSGVAGRLLERLLFAPPDPEGWVTLDVGTCGLASHAIEIGLGELQSRQMAFVDYQRPLLKAAHTPTARRALDRAILELRKRREVDAAKLSAMVSYATVRTCRRRFILDYFGDRTTRRDCGNCDRCSPDT